MGIPEIRSVENAERYEAGNDSAGLENLDELAKRLSPDLAGSAMRRGPGPRDLLDKIASTNALPRNSLFSQERMNFALERTQIDLATIGRAEYRIFGEMGKETGAEVARIARAFFGGKPAGSFLTVKHGEMRILRGDQEIVVSAEGQGHMANMHLLQDGDVIEGTDGGHQVEITDTRVAPRAADASPLATGALSLGGMMAFSPEILKIGAIATAASFLGHYIFSSGVKPSLFRRFLHFFSNDMAVKDWHDKARELRRSGKIEEAKPAYEKAIELASKHLPSGQSTYEGYERLAAIQHEYGFFLYDHGEVELGNKLSEYSAQSLMKAAEHAPSKAEKIEKMEMSLNERIAIHATFIVEGHEAGLRGDRLTAAKYYEKAADFPAGRSDTTIREGRVYALARAWQHYVSHYSTPERREAQQAAVIKVIKTGNSFGIAGATVWDMVRQLDREDGRKKR